MFKLFQFKMYGIVPKYLAFLLFSVVCISLGIATSHADDAANWQKIQEADSKLQSVRLDWLYTWTIGPHPALSEQTYQHLADQMRDKGLNADAVKSEVEASRAFDKELTQGVEYDGAYKCLRVKQEMRIDISSSLKSSGVSTPQPPIINYTDGKTGLRIDGTTVGSHSSLPQWGEIVANSDPGQLLFSVPDSEERLLLFAMPLTSVFPPAETKMTDNGNDTVTLETVESPNSDFPITIRGTISKTTWRPVKIEQFLPHVTSPSNIFEASDFHAYGNGVWVPTHFTYEIPANRDTISYTLQKAVIGEKIPDEDIKIMYGPNIQDCRFGDCIQYKLISGIIPDKEKVDEMKSGAHPDVPPSPDGNVPMLAPPLFALFLAGLGGLVFWSETRKSKKSGK